MGFYRIQFKVDLRPDKKLPEGAKDRYTTVASEVHNLDEEIKMWINELSTPFDNVRHLKTSEITKEEYDGLVK